MKIGILTAISELRLKSHTSNSKPPGLRPGASLGARSIRGTTLYRAAVFSDDRHRLAGDHREQQKESQLRHVERIGNIKAELRGKEEIRGRQAAGERGHDGNRAAVMHRHHHRRQQIDKYQRLGVEKRVDRKQRAGGDKNRGQGDEQRPGRSHHPTLLQRIGYARDERAPFQSIKAHGSPTSPGSDAGYRIRRDQSAGMAGTLTGAARPNQTAPSRSCILRTGASSQTYRMTPRLRHTRNNAPKIVSTTWKAISTPYTAPIAKPNMIWPRTLDGEVCGSVIM